MENNQFEAGNIVNIEEGEELFIKTIDSLDYNRERVRFINESKARSVEDISPIDLTRQWLFDFGFIYMGQKQSDDTIQLYSLGSITIELAPAIQSFSFYPGSKDIEHVHELQNEYYKVIGKPLVLKK